MHYDFLEIPQKYDTKIASSLIPPTKNGSHSVSSDIFSLEELCEMLCFTKLLDESKILEP